MKQAWIVITLVALCAGLTSQFVWKMIYFPEPIIPVIFELISIYGITGLAIYCAFSISPQKARSKVNKLKGKYEKVF